MEILHVLLTDPRTNLAKNMNELLRCSLSDTVVNYLLDHPRINPAENNNEILHNAAQDNDIEVVKLLLAHPRVTPTVEEVIRLMVYHDTLYLDFTDLKRFLATHPQIDPAADDNKALYYACSVWRADVTKILLADPRVGTDEVINDIIRNLSMDVRRYDQMDKCVAGDDDIETLELLLSDPRSDPARNTQIIRDLLEDGRARVLKVLLADPLVDLTANNNEVLKSAILGGNLQVVRLLIADHRFDNFDPRELCSLLTNKSISGENK
jgi:hypothetical protein